MPKLDIILKQLFHKLRLSWESIFFCGKCGTSKTRISLQLPIYEFMKKLTLFAFYERSLQVLQKLLINVVFCDVACGDQGCEIFLQKLIGRRIGQKLHVRMGGCVRIHIQNHVAWLRVIHWRLRVIRSTTVCKHFTGRSNIPHIENCTALICVQRYACIISDFIVRDFYVKTCTSWRYRTRVKKTQYFDSVVYGVSDRPRLRRPCFRCKAIHSHSSCHTREKRATRITFSDVIQIFGVRHFHVKTDTRQGYCTLVGKISVTRVTRTKLWSAIRGHGKVWTGRRKSTCAQKRTTRVTFSYGIALSVAYTILWLGNVGTGWSRAPSTCKFLL